MAVDIFGNLLVYDSNDKKLKIIYPNGCILNLINGACREDNGKVACYKSWVTKEEEDLCRESLEQVNCEKQSFLCDQNSYSLLVGKGERPPQEKI